MAHSFTGGDEGLTYLAYGTYEPNDICYYPRSNKIALWGVGVIGSKLPKGPTTDSSPLLSTPRERKERRPNPQRPFEGSTLSLSSCRWAC